MLFAECVVRVEGRTFLFRVFCVSISTVREYGRHYFAKRAHYRPIRAARLMIGNDDFVDEWKFLYDLRALFCRHKCEPLFVSQPIVVIEDHDELVSEFPRRFKHPHVPDMQWIETARDRDPPLLLLRISLFSTHGPASLSRCEDSSYLSAAAEQ